jgi:hypothetical protein
MSEMTSPHDDLVGAFQIEGEPVRGRIARLGPAIDTILRAHDYPEPVANLLGEACALAALVGSNLKFEGRLIVEARGSGPVRYVVADYDTTGGLRGYCRFDSDEVAAALADHNYHLTLDGLTSLPPEQARYFSKKNNRPSLRRWMIDASPKLTTLSPLFMVRTSGSRPNRPMSKTLLTEPLMLHLRLLPLPASFSGQAHRPVMTPKTHAARAGSWTGTWRSATAPPCAPR